MITKIRTDSEYEKIMKMIEAHLNKATHGGGFSSLTSEESQELKKLSLLAESWEDSIPIMPLDSPKTLAEMIELKMYQMKLKQKDLASLLGIAPSRLSEVLSGKRKINLDLAKRLYNILNIDAAFILNNA